MRLAYLDEAGTSNPDHEPYLVVAGIILDGDHDWQPLKRHLASIARRYLPSDDQIHFIFHAKDIWHGSGYFDRTQWSREKRIQILHEIISIPAKFHLPVVVGAIHRLAFREHVLKRYPETPGSRINDWAHAEAYVQAIAEIDRWMQRKTRNEVAMIVAEDTPTAKGAIKLLHAGATQDEDLHYDGEGYDVFATRHIIDTVHFANKQDSALLQIADTCAFIVKRQCMGKKDIAPHFQTLIPQLISPPRDGIWTLPAETLPRMRQVFLPRRSVELLQ